MQRTYSRTRWPLGAALLMIAVGVPACDARLTDSEDSLGLLQEGLSTSGNAPQLAAQPGTVVTNKKPNLLSGRGGLSFDVNATSAGTYHIRVWALGAQANSKLPVYLDQGSTPIATLTTTNNTWRHYDLIAADGSDVISLSVGNHTLSFRVQGDQVPDVESVEISKDKPPASNAEANFKGYIASLQARTLGADYRARKQAEASGVTALAAGPAPSDNFCSSLNFPFSYSYRGLFYLNASQAVTFETRKADPYGSDPVMYLFSQSNPQSYSWSNDDYNGLQSRISVTIPVAGYYYVLVRAYNPSSPGTSDLYKDNALYQSNIAIAGNRLYCSLNKTGMLNYFTGFISADPMLWLVEGSGFPGLIRAYNDDFGQPSGSFTNWGTMSRVRRNSSTPLSYAIVTAYSSSVTSAVSDLYLENEDGDIMPFFPNLPALDAIKSAPQDGSYNCIAWSGGTSSRWEWPPNPSDPWYDPNFLVGFDKWYGNTPSRFPGAFTYTRSGATEANAVVDLWALPNGTYTHGSVIKPGDNLPHGYWFESKPGGLSRTFHPPYALSGNDYGNVVAFYRWPGNVSAMATGTSAMTTTAAAPGSSEPTLEGAVRAGTAVIEQADLTSSEATKLQTLKGKLAAPAAQQFETLYNAWKATWTRPEIAIHSDPKKYAESAEYTKLLSFLQQQGKASWPHLIEKYLGGDRFTLIPIQELTLPAQEADMTRIRQESQQERFTPDGKYVVPSLETNMRKYVQAVLSKL
jgi:hypothetical protein